MESPIVVDCDYLFPQYAASYLVIEDGSAAFIENNTTLAVPKLLTALKWAGLRPEDVEYVVITHVHLDHAGGSSALMQACPNATLLAHPRAARHVVDPTKIIAGARTVYGAERFEKLYGKIEPIPAQRVREMGDEEVLRWGTREWRFLHTRGHAKHHFCLWDSKLRGVFTGDAFGIQYPELQGAERFTFPSTSPTDFEPGEARAAVQRISDLDGDRAFLTHYGEVHDLAEAAEQLIDWIDFSEEIWEDARQREEKGDALTQFCSGPIDDRFRSELEARGLMSAANWELTRLDRELNAAGIAYAAEKARHA